MKEAADKAKFNNVDQVKNPKGAFAKTTKGIAIAERIGIPQMRAQCPLFDGWLGELEALVG